jgi:hypothetical protein
MGGKEGEVEVAWSVVREAWRRVLLWGRAGGLACGSQR